MGYDFLMLELPDRVASLRAAYNEMLYRYHLDPELSGAFLGAKAEFSFHLNLAGMGFCRETITALGRLAEAEPEPFPAHLDWDRSLYETAGEHRSANPDVWTDHQESERRAMTQTGDGPEIASFRFLSNGPFEVA